MKIKILYLFVFICFKLYFCSRFRKIAQEITDEGIQLYRNEMASWYGTDVFVENYKQRKY
jgi:hypothetical protein